jgi:hypothetical protein
MLRLACLLVHVVAACFALSCPLCTSAALRTATVSMTDGTRDPAENAESCLDDEECSLFTATELVSELEVESRMLATRAQKNAELIAYLKEKTKESDENLTAEEVAMHCIEDGCPIDAVGDVIDELKQIKRGLSERQQSYARVDELVGVLNSHLGRARGTSSTESQF